MIDRQIQNPWAQSKIAARSTIVPRGFGFVYQREREREEKERERERERQRGGGLVRWLVRAPPS